jgi:hypothetical protein
VARTKKPKQGVMPGFPKLAFYMGAPKTIYLPAKSNSWRSISHKLYTEELVVLVGYNERWGYYDERMRWTGGNPVYFIVPVAAIAENRIPVTCIHRWRQSYTRLAVIPVEQAKIIQREDGKELIAAAA